ncbi:MAG: hypothetical protein Q7J98_06755 [Kiritimatiellia bacterium]|nr:hypothetical protein [Kiritimatiellia bacterium]
MRPDYCALLTSGMATAASSMMGIYVLFLADTFPTIALAPERRKDIVATGPRALLAARL